MIPALRKAFNGNFTKEKYEAFLNELGGVYPGQLDFRVAETPVFVDQAFKKKTLDCCEKIVNIMPDLNFKKYKKNPCLPNRNVPNKNKIPISLVFNFEI